MEQTSELLEVAELGASAATRAIFDQIKTLSGVPMIALIYRHMATRPGMLEWAWQTLEPVMVTGQLQMAAWGATKEVELPNILPIPRVARRAVGISEEDESQISNLLAAFNRANSVNSVAIRYLIRQLDAAGASFRTNSGSMSDWHPPLILPDLPPMLSLEEINGPVLELISWLCHRGEGRHRRVWPSLYRYLAAQPAFLAFAGIILTPEFERIDQMVNNVRAEMELVANSLPIYPSFYPTEFEYVESDLRLTIEEFSSLIPEMLLIGLLLEHSMVS